MDKYQGYSPVEACRGNIKRETDRAIQLLVVNARGEYRHVWLPKSQIKLVGNIAWLPDWLLAAKGRDPAVNGIITVNRDVALRAEG